MDEIQEMIAALDGKADPLVIQILKDLADEVEELKGAKAPAPQG